MVRGILIVLVTVVLLVATVVAIVGAGMRRIAADQRRADAQWQPSPPTTAPATVPSLAALDDPPAPDPELPVKPAYRTIELMAKDAAIRGQVHLVDPKTLATHGDPPTDPKELARWKRREANARSQKLPFLTGFKTKDDYVEWPVQAPKAGDYEVDLTYACPQWQDGGHFSVRVGEQELSVTSEGTRNAGTFRVTPIGKITLNAGGNTLSFRGAPASMKSSSFIYLRSVQLIAADGGATAP